MKRELAEREYCFPGRAALPCGKLLTHRPQGQMGVSGLYTSVPGTVRVWSAVADTPQSNCAAWVAAGTQTETANQSSVFFSRQGEESERSGIILPDARGWSTEWQVEVGSRCPLG